MIDSVSLFVLANPILVGVSYFLYPRSHFPFLFHECIVHIYFLLLTVNVQTSNEIIIIRQSSFPSNSCSPTPSKESTTWNVSAVSFSLFPLLKCFFSCACFLCKSLYSGVVTAGKYLDVATTTRFALFRFSFPSSL